MPLVTADEPPGHTAVAQPARATASASAPPDPVAVAPGSPPAAAAPAAASAPASPALGQPTALDDEPAALVWPRTVETELGGLFFLVNLALFLELYGDFTQPRHADLAMPLFDFIELLGRALGADGDDPVWALLAELSGRDPAQPPGADFVPPVAWAVSDAWLAPFAADDDAWSISAPPGRWRLHHPAGFVAADLPWLPTAPSRSRWLAWITAYARARLRRATGLPDLAPLWRRRGRVFVTGARLDVELALSDHPIELRIAGLDRDPGWIPGAGRDLRFHFH